MKVRIDVLNRNTKIPSSLIDAAGGDEFMARIFYNRGYTDAHIIRQMLNDEMYIPTHLWEFPRMEDAVKRLARAVEEGETIMVYGDYDVDGVTSTAVLVESIGRFTSKVLYHVPDRFTEGYGMNEDIIRSLPQKDVSLIVTCDCGISNIQEISVAKKLGMDVIVTDHHNIPGQLPPADVILNPKLLPEGHKARNLSGCAMAYFLCTALLKHYHREDDAECLLDLIALSLIADVVSLHGENRYLLKKALPRLFQTPRPGLEALFSIIGQHSKVSTEEDVAFQVAPRINAAGRMKSARVPVELFLTKDSNHALELAREMDFLNNQRKKIQQQMIEEASELVQDTKKNKTVLVLFHEFWHHGVIGIAAGKITEIYNRPSILLTLKEDGTTVVGSARSVEGIDIYELIRQCGGKLQKFGGHPMAAGLSLHKDDLQEFVREIEILAEKLYFINDTVNVQVDAELGLQEIDLDFYKRISSAGPYGEGFAPPVFFTRGVSVVCDRKTEKKHHIMVLSGEHNIRVPAVKWYGGEMDLQGRVFDITYQIGINTYRGNSELRLTVDHIIMSDGSSKKAFEGEFIDERGTHIGTVIERYNHGVAFYEGLQSTCFVEGTVNRFGIQKADTLILLSTPVNTSVFREVICLANPQKVVISFAFLPDYSFRGFVMNFMGVLKHILHCQHGRTDMETLALRMCVEENIIKCALKYLKTMGKIEYSSDGEDPWIVLKKVNKTPAANVRVMEKKLRDALAEKEAYQLFLLRLSTEKFNEYMK